MKTIQRFLTKTLFVGALIIGVTLSSSVAQAQSTGTGGGVNANAGSDQTITLPTNSVTLSGSSTGFSGFVPPSYSWARIQGSGNINSPSQAMTNITGLTQGTSVFRLTAYDGFQTAIDDVSIIVNPAGLGGGGATVDAGSDQTLYYPNDTTTLSGSSNGINGIVLYYTWENLSGSASIGSPNTSSTNVSRLSLGDNEFRLTVTNNTGTTASDDVVVRVLQAGPPLNILPTAYAGSDQVIYTPNSTAYLLGNGTDPDGTIVSYSWAKISGSGTISGMTGSGAGDAITITGLTLGESVFRLTVTDNQGGTGTDDVTIKVLNGGCTGTGCGGSGTGGTGGTGGGGSGGGVSVCPVGTTGTYPNCTISTTNTNPIYFVNTTKLNIRASASASSAKVATVTSRTLLEVLEGNRSTTWIKVKTNTGVTGYVMTRYTQQLVKIGNKASITVRLVNVRSDESLRFKPLRTLKPTDVVDIMYVSPITSWVKVKSADGKTGFVNKYLLKVVQ
jgi:hypothetical protein